MTDDSFYEDQQVATDDELSEVGRLCEKMAEMEEKVKIQEELLKESKKEYFRIATELLPEAMAAARVSEFSTVDGLKVSVGDTVSGSLPKDIEKRAKALTWLKQNGAEGIIKDSIAIELDKGQLEIAHKIMAEAEGLGAAPILREDVNHMSLKAFAREQFNGGIDVPFEDLGLWHGKMAKIKRR